MKAVNAHEDADQVLDQFQQLTGQQTGGVIGAVSHIAMLLAAGRYCRHRHLSLGKQSTFQRNVNAKH